MSIESDLESIALKIAAHANGEDVLFKDRLDSFKALTSYYFHKNNPKKQKEDEDEPTDSFNSFRERVASATDSGTSDSD